VQTDLEKSENKDAMCHAGFRKWYQRALNSFGPDLVHMSPVVSLEVRQGVSACFLIMQMHEVITTILLVYVLCKRDMKTLQEAGSNIRFPVHS
jgi:hypothetical protein